MKTSPTQPLNHRLGAVVRFRRIATGRTQTALARALGLPPSSACDLEKGRTTWSVEYAASAARFLETPLAVLLAEARAEAP